jgi:hypothetical protein
MLWVKCSIHMLLVLWVLHWLLILRVGCRLRGLPDLRITVIWVIDNEQNNLLLEVSPHPSWFESDGRSDVGENASKAFSSVSLCSLAQRDSQVERTALARSLKEELSSSVDVFGGRGGGTDDGVDTEGKEVSSLPVSDIRSW